MPVELNAALFDALAKKIEGLDLSDDESAALELILNRAAALDSDDDVEAFAHNSIFSSKDGQGITGDAAVIVGGYHLSQKLGLGAGVDASILTWRTEDVSG